MSITTNANLRPPHLALDEHDFDNAVYWKTVMPRKFTVPLTGQPGTRISKSNAQTGASGVVGIGIVGQMIVGATAQATDKDERWINCFLTTVGGRKKILKRPGYATNTTPEAGSIGNAILIWTGASNKIMTAFGNTNSTLYDGTTSKGAITGLARSITETKVGNNVATVLIPSADSTAWYYDNGASVAVATKISDGDFPGNAGYTTAGSFASIDGFNCIMSTDGKLWASDLNSITGWTANSYDSANDYPDSAVGCIRWKDKVIAFGTESMQFFYNAGLTPFPLAKVGGNSTIKIGAISADAIATISDYVYWIGGTDKGGLTIYQYDGSVSRISTPEIDAQMVLYSTTGMSVSTERVYGRSFVLVKIGTTTTYCYCIEDKRWYERQTTTPLWYKCAGLSSGSQIITYAISNVSTSGKVYIINPSSLVFTDDGAAFTASVQSNSDDGGTPYRKFYGEFRLDADVEPTTSTLTVSYSDDDFATFVVAGTIDLSAPQKLTRLGASSPTAWNKRAWKLSHSANTAMGIYQADYFADVGTA